MSIKPYLCHIVNIEPNNDNVYEPAEVFNIHAISHNDLSRLTALVKEHKDQFSPEFIKHLSYILELERDSWISTGNDLFEPI